MNDKLDWWRKNRFGMFVHWGLYSATEGYWHGKETKGIGEWIQSREKIPLGDYRSLAEKMTLEDFDADAWVALAKKSGMGHIVITAKHHEGFAMYDSACSDYNIVKMGPSGRDPLKELSEACQRGGIRFCIYYSHALDFEHPDAYGNDWDYDPKNQNFENYFEEKCKPQLRELLSNYGPVGLVWFDMPDQMTYEQSLELRDLVKEIQPDCIAGARLGHELQDYGSLGDNELPCGVVTGDWETPATLNDTWGYKRDDNNWKTVPELIESLAELSSCGVNYLLNIGPMANGEIPEESVRLLEGIGEWMNINGGSIIGSQSSPFISQGDNWFATCKKDKIFLFLRQWTSSVKICGLRNKILSASILGAPEQEVAVSQNQEKAELCLPEIPPDSNMNVIMLDFDGEPICSECSVEQTEGCIYLPASQANIFPGKTDPVMNPDNAGPRDELQLETRMLMRKPNGVVVNWHREDDHISWQFEVNVPGEFEVIVRTQGKKYGEWEGGFRLRAVIADAVTEDDLNGKEPVHKPRTRYFPERGSNLGSLKIDKAGIHTLKLDVCKFSDISELSVTELVLRRKNIISETG